MSKNPRLILLGALLTTLTLGLNGCNTVPSNQSPTNGEEVRPQTEENNYGNDTYENDNTPPGTKAP